MRRLAKILIVVCLLEMFFIGYAYISTTFPPILDPYETEQTSMEQAKNVKEYLDKLPEISKGLISWEHWCLSGYIKKLTAPIGEYNSEKDKKIAIVNYNIELVKVRGLFPKILALEFGILISCIFAGILILIGKEVRLACFVACCVPLLTAKNISNVVIGSHNESYMYWAAIPFVLGLIILIGRFLNWSVESPSENASDETTKQITVGLFVVVVGVVLIIGSFALSKAVGAGFLIVSIWPVLYGFFIIYQAIKNKAKIRQK